MFSSRSRVAGGISLALTLGMIVNVFGLQDAHRPSAAMLTGALPAAPADASGRAAVLMPVSATAGSSDPIGRLLANADADLAARAGPGAVAGLPATDAPPADEKLVSSIQRELAAHGYDPGRINGVAGLITRCAILAFEYDQHFALTAEPSEELLSRIVLGMSGAAGEAAMPPGDKAKRIINGTQRLLVRLGYDPGQITGGLNEATQRALRRFEADSGLLPKGRISGELMSELARRAHARIEVSDEAIAN